MVTANSREEDRTELETYRSVLEKAIRDGKGKITTTKAQILIKLRSSLGISDMEHARIMEELLDLYEESNLATYRSAIEKALLDDKMSMDEEAILDLLRKSMNISMYEHERIVNEVKDKIRSKKGFTQKYEEIPDDEPYSEITEESEDDINTAVSPDSEEEGLGSREIETDEESYFENGYPHDSTEEMTEEDQEYTDDGNYEDQDPDSDQVYIETQEFEETDDENDSYYWVRKGEIAWVSSEGNINQALNALQHFDKALELDPDNYLAWANKGLILKTLDKVEEALLCYNRALKINPDYVTVWYNKGVLLGSIGNFEEAIKAFNKVLKLNPEHEFAQRDRAILLSLLSDDQENT